MSNADPNSPSPAGPELTTGTPEASPGPSQILVTLRAVEQVAMQRSGLTQRSVRLLAAAAAALLVVLAVAVPQMMKSDCDRLGDLIAFVNQPNVGMNQRDEYAGEFSELLHKCADSGDPLPDNFYDQP